MVQDGGMRVLSWAQSDIWSACSWQTARSYPLPILASRLVLTAPQLGPQARVGNVGFV